MSISQIRATNPAPPKTKKCAAGEKRRATPAKANGQLAVAALDPGMLVQGIDDEENRIDGEVMTYPPS
ncbi:hypothetical protein ABWJ86_00490, partial [Enterococcus faecalis]|uniref:hypothetical protein n=1 Tax=Enterococcus faecalis TaxID=1351 RepID=UPI0033957825